MQQQRKAARGVCIVLQDLQPKHFKVVARSTSIIGMCMFKHHEHLAGHIHCI